jgi:hypothetical protein
VAKNPPKKQGSNLSIIERFEVLGRYYLFGLGRTRTGDKFLYITESTRGRILVMEQDLPDFVAKLAEAAKVVEKAGAGICPGCKDPEWRERWLMEEGEPLKNHPPEGTGTCNMCGYALTSS